MSTKFDVLIKNYERLLAGPSPNDERFNKTIELLDELQEECDSLGSLRERGVSQADRDHWYTRIAGALTSYIATPHLTFTMRQVEVVCRRKPIIDYIFHASGYRKMNHLVTFVSVEKDGAEVLKAESAPVLFAFMSIDAMTDALMM